MGYINRVPLILSALMTIIIGLISFDGYDSVKDTYKKMSVSIVVFYIVGIIIKNTFLEIEKDIKKKEKERRDEQEKQEKLEKLEKLGKRGKQGSSDVMREESVKVPEPSPQKIDYRAED